MHASSSSHFSRLRYIVCTSWRISGRESGALDRFRWPWRQDILLYSIVTWESEKNETLIHCPRYAIGGNWRSENAALARSSSFVPRNAANTDSRAVVEPGRTPGLGLIGRLGIAEKTLAPARRIFPKNIFVVCIFRKASGVSDYRPKLSRHRETYPQYVYMCIV